MKEFFKRTVVSILTFEAKLLLKRVNPKIIGITGSVGKTSTKDAIYAVLKNHVHARKSDKSFNSDIGVALTILGLPNAWSNPIMWAKEIFDGLMHALFPGNYPDVLVLEMGVDRPGDMKRLTQWIKPDIAVVTRLPDVPVHVEFFHSPEEVVAEKMILVSALKQDGVFIYNNDDEKVRPYVEDTRQQSFGFSRYSQSHFMATGDSILYDGATPIGMEFDVTHMEESAHAVVRGSVGIQHVYTYTAAMAVGSLFDIPLKDAAEALSSAIPPAGRMRLLPGTEGSTVIDDTYNSSPVACEHAIQTLSEIKTTGRRIAVLGDMLELGQYSVREHERIGELAASRVSILMTLGVRARKIADGAKAYGLPEGNVLQYDDQEELSADLKSNLKPHDIVLIKASQGMRAERIVAAVMAEPEKAPELLVRQEAIWEKK